MLVLYIYLFLNQYSKSITEVSAFLKTTPYCRDKGGTWENSVCEWLSIDKSTLADTLQSNGIGVTSHILWDRIIKINAYDAVCSAVASELKISNNAISASVIVRNQVVHYIVQALISVKSFYNTNLYLTIQAKAREIAKNLSSQIITDVKGCGGFNAKIRRGEVIRTWTDGINDYQENLESFETISKKALRNVKDLEFKQVLHDIAMVTPLMSFKSVNRIVKNYTLFACFLQAHAEFQIKAINKKLNPTLTVIFDNTSSVKGIRKFRKYDLLLQKIHPYIINGINRNNIYELSRMVYEFLVFEQNSQVTLLARANHLPTSDLKEWSGNFNTKTMYKVNEDSEAFHTFMIGIMALGKLYRWLKTSELSPFCIDPDIWLFGDPSVKFNSLEEFVVCNRKYCQVRRKYFENINSNIIVNISSSESKYELSLLRRKRLDSTTLTKRLREICNNDWGLILINGMTEAYTAPLKLVIEALWTGVNPVISLVAEEEVVYDEEDFFEDNPEYIYNFSRENCIDWFEKAQDILELTFHDWYLGRYTKSQLTEELTGISDDIVVLIEDLLPKSLQDKSYLWAIKKMEAIFNEIYMEMSGSISNSKYIISQLELALVCSQMRFAANIRTLENIPVSERPEKVFSALAHTYQENYELTEQEIELCIKILTGNFQSLYLNKVISIFNVILNEVYSLIVTSESIFEHLSDDMTRPPVTGQKLLQLRSTLDGMRNETDFNIYVENQKFSMDQDGYYLRPDGSYVIISVNNKVGYLHSLGMYVFTDGSVSRWRAK